MKITIEVHQASDYLPDADTDVLVLAEGDTEMQLGAYVGEESDGPVWTDAQGELLLRVVAWAKMPKLPASSEARTVALRGGGAVDLAAAWRVPG